MNNMSNKSSYEHECFGNGKSLFKQGPSDKCDAGTLCYEGYGNLYLNITNQCTASCIFCIREQCNGVYGYDLRLSRDPDSEELKVKLGELDLTKYDEVVFTGFGEPTTRFDVVLEITKWLKARNIRVRLDTNGHAQLLYPKRDVIAELKDAGLDEISISLNAEDATVYEKICRPSLPHAYEAMLDLAREAVLQGIETRMTVVRIPEINIDECEKIARGLGAEFYVR